jgi:hypothetical protein
MGNGGVFSFLFSFVCVFSLVLFFANVTFVLDFDNKVHSKLTSAERGEILEYINSKHHP